MFLYDFSTFYLTSFKKINKLENNYIEINYPKHLLILKGEEFKIKLIEQGQIIIKGKVREVMINDKLL